MKTNLIKKLIILCIILIIIIVLLLTLLSNNSKDIKDKDYVDAKETEDYIKEHGIEQISDDDKQKINNTVKRQDFMIVKNCMQAFLHTININNSAYTTVQNGREIRLYTEEEISSKVYELLSNNYIKNNNITPNNVFNYIDKLEQNVIFIPLEIKEVENDELKTFIVHGIVENNDYKVLQEIYSLINIDEAKHIYSIELLDNNYKDINSIEIKSLEENITKQNLNIYREPTSTPEDMIRLYIDIYKNLALGIPELSYKYLNEEYKTKRFGDLEQYKKYIESNRDYIIGINATQYKTEETDTNTEYIILDNKNNYIIINERSALNFELMLDAYTINTREISEKYNNSSNSEKVGMNVDKFIQMINRKDYKTSYNILADSFKSNKFKTQSEFENYIKNNFFEKNIVNISQIQDEGNYYNCKVSITDKNGNETKEISIIMQLKEGTDFVMSFNIE